MNDEPIRNEKCIKQKPINNIIKERMNQRNSHIIAINNDIVINMEEGLQYIFNIENGKVIAKIRKMKEEEDIGRYPMEHLRDWGIYPMGHPIVLEDIGRYPMEHPRDWGIYPMGHPIPFNNNNIVDTNVLIRTSPILTIEYIENLRKDNGDSIRGTMKFLLRGMCLMGITGNSYTRKQLEESNKRNKILLSMGGRIYGDDNIRTFWYRATRPQYENPPGIRNFNDYWIRA